MLCSFKDKGEWKILVPSGKFPSPRRRHSCCVIDDKMYLFGGTGLAFAVLLIPLLNVPIHILVFVVVKKKTIIGNQ